jgi:hypothetical protein
MTVTIVATNSHGVVVGKHLGGDYCVFSLAQGSVEDGDEVASAFANADACERDARNLTQHRDIRICVMQPDCTKKDALQLVADHANIVRLKLGH